MRRRSPRGSLPSTSCQPVRSEGSTNPSRSTRSPPKPDPQALKKSIATEEASAAALKGVMIDTERFASMRGLRWAMAVAGAGVVAAAAVAVGTAQADTPPPPIGVEVLTQRGGSTDDVELQIQAGGPPDERHNTHNPSRTAVARITVQPGAHFPWHTHPGPVIVNVTAGELVYVQASDCVERPYAAGTAFVDPGRGNVHTAFNPSDEVTVLVATFFEVPRDGTVDHPRRGSGRLHALTELGAASARIPLEPSGGSPRSSHLRVRRARPDRGVLDPRRRGHAPRAREVRLPPDGGRGRRRAGRHLSTGSASSPDPRWACKPRLALGDPWHAPHARSPITATDLLGRLLAAAIAESRRRLAGSRRSERAPSAALPVGERRCCCRCCPGRAGKEPR